MYSKNILAASGAFLALAAAIPMQHEHHHRRDLLWVTEVEEVVVTVAVTSTVWVDGEEATAAASVQHTAPSSTTAQATQAVVANTKPYVQPSSATTSTSEYVAPTPASTSSSVSTSTSVYVAPPPASTSTSVYIAPAPASTSTSVYIAPAPVTSAQVESTTHVAEPTTSSVYVAPTTSSVYIAPSSTAVQAVAAQTAASSGSSSGGVISAYLPSLAKASNSITGLAASGTRYTGDFTNYDPSVGAGACGYTPEADWFTVAISHTIWDAYVGANPNNNVVCNQVLNISGKDGKVYKAVVADRCPGCAEGGLDMSLKFFNMVTDNGDGRVSGMQWSWN